MARRPRKSTRRSNTRPPGTRRAEASPRPVAGPPTAVAVERVGAQGDGIAEDETLGRLYIPLAAPGDRLTVRPGARRGDGRVAAIETIDTPGPDRVTPPCRHFGTCGGCALQHLSAAAIAREKRALLADALARKGLEDVPVSETVAIAPGGRRRARFAMRRVKGRTILGFNERQGARIVDLDECPLLEPALAAMLPDIRHLATRLPSLGTGGDLHIQGSETGADLLFLPDKPGDPGLAEREAIAAFAEARGIARISWTPAPGAPPEPVAARAAPRVSFAGIAIHPPPGAFLQPSLAGERAITAAVAAAVGPAERVADLYAGCGSIGLSLAVMGKAVHAAEGLADHVDAFRKAGGAAGLRVSAEVRDLAAEPLSAAELARFDAVVFDPPRAGAADQAAALAASAVPRIAAVSCNPATLARDLSILVEGGYRVLAATPIDQFPWSGHLEAVAVLARE
ncbi:class I SAM-dependent RNA methyltransferase [Marivibrio halodurans]|uniref:Class I SAM-dependent RNA methyltransferase n=1 Tax=Marivibrio halodurans TaxID=2039722 RepID=A0A8J7RZL3_9PROT|nr:class I SAM-dependent RNA methyltransferase [Marivibrio halodurans]MBP5857215.1 class I SAM-dependent RNA methyltransferase [Marivibrio halodurans]